MEFIKMKNSDMFDKEKFDIKEGDFVYIGDMMFSYEGCINNDKNSCI